MLHLEEKLRAIISTYCLQHQATLRNQQKLAEPSAKISRLQNPTLQSVVRLFNWTIRPYII